MPTAVEDASACGAARTRGSRRRSACRPTSRTPARRRRRPRSARRDNRRRRSATAFRRADATRRDGRTSAPWSCAKLFEWPPSIAYDASVNGAPAKPISGTRPRSSRLDLADRLQHVRQRLARLEHASGGRCPRRVDRPFELRAFAFDEVEGQSHRLERQQQVRKQDGRVDVDPADRLQRDFGGEVGRRGRSRAGNGAREGRGTRPCNGRPAA